MKNTFLLFLVFLCSCTSLDLPKIEVDEAKKIELSIIPGSVNVERYKTVSRVKVHALDAQKRKTLTEKKIEISNFNLNREALTVDPNGDVQFKYFVTDLQGDVDLTNMGLPPEGRVLVEIVDKFAKVRAVQGFPVGTIFYLPKIALPSQKVKPGDQWVYQGEWRSLKTGWPFQVTLNLSLKNFVQCGGLRCAHITYDGQISLPDTSPLKKSVLKSKVEGEFVYSPIGHQFLWSYAKSVETFESLTKLVSVKSCTASYQVSPSKEEKVFSKKITRVCN